MEKQRDGGLELRSNTLIPGEGRKAELDLIRKEHPGLLDAKPGVVFCGPARYINPRYASDSLKAIEKIQAKNALAFKEIDKVIASVRAARAASSCSTKAKAETKGGYVLNHELGSSECPSTSK